VTTTTPAPINYTGNFSYDIINTTRAAPSDPLTQLYSVTYMYYSLIGCFISILIGWTVSYFTGSESDLYDQELIHPVARKMANFFPGKKRRYAEKTVEDKTTRNGSMMNASASATSMDRKVGTANPAFAQDVPMEQMEVYRTKL
jgi:sodium-coupled monocarboxylate transporter 8/12